MPTRRLSGKAAPADSCAGRKGEVMECDKETLRLMEELTQAIGVSGQERQVCRILNRYYEALADEVVRDSNGSIYAVRHTDAPDPFRVMVAAHSDEVGMVVKQIKPNGLIKTSTIGGLWEDVLLGARLRLCTDDDREFRGCVSALSTKMMRDKISAGSRIPTGELYMDFGFLSEEDARAQGVLEGNQIVVDGPFAVLNGGRRLLAKAWDNRFGCILGIELLRRLKDVPLPFELYVGANVQEEVGLRGARTAANLIRPDLAVVLDCTAANDVERFEPPCGGIGHGVMVRFNDGTYLPNRAVLLDYLALLKEEKIPFQFHESKGGTDAGAINSSGCGVPALTACICARNVHTGSLMIDSQDYLHCLEAVTAWISRLTAEKLERFRHHNS